MLLTTLILVFNLSDVHAKPKRKAVVTTPGPSLLQILGELKTLSEAQSKKCDQWIEDFAESMPSEVKGKSKYPLTILPKLYQKIDEFPSMSEEILTRLETLSRTKPKSENAKDEAKLINQVEIELQRCAPLSSVAFLDNLIESIPEGDTETLKLLSMKLSEKIAPEIEGGGFFPMTLIQAGLLESAIDHYPERGAWLSSRVGGIFKRGQKLKIKYHRKLIDTSIEESATQYLKVKLDGLKDTWTLRQQLRMILTDAGLRREKARTGSAPKVEPAPASSPSPSPSVTPAAT